MIQSMTAFAKKIVLIDDSEVSVEIKSINHRYFDLSLKLPDFLSEIESSVRNLLQRKLIRGRIECSITVQSITAEGRRGKLNLSVLTGLVEDVRTIQPYFTTTQLDLLKILNWPGIYEKKQFNFTVEKLLPVIEETIQAVIKMRMREGEALASVIQEKLAIIQQKVDFIFARRSNYTELYRNKLLAKLQELSVATINSDRLEQELLFFVQKSDVTEELDRLKAHIQAVLNILSQEEIVGKKLDFLMQEFNREANTLSAKAAHLEVTNGAIELKVLIEQMREQVQNIL